ncbi:MAG: methionine biosynthesis protein MetW [Candidatus Margulisiibacteriota bacterium]
MKLYQKIVFNQIKSNERVLDLGCGSGLLLDKLRTEKGCEGYGIEKNFDEVIIAIKRGIPIFQGDIIEGLKQFESKSFDVAILSQTLQQVISPVEVLKEMCRVSNRVIITFPNFGYWKVRMNLLFKGLSPKTKQLPYEWYDTPNIRVITINDFRRLCYQHQIRILKEIPLVKNKFQRVFFPLRLTNFFTEKGIFILKKDEC